VEADVGVGAGMDAGPVGDTGWAVGVITPVDEDEPPVDEDVPVAETAPLDEETLVGEDVVLDEGVPSGVVTDAPGVLVTPKGGVEPLSPSVVI
jgi:hypothetical protein